MAQNRPSHPFRVAPLTFGKEIVNLKSNNLSGSIPSGLRWRQLFLLDLGFNGLTGTLPVELGETFGSLRRECPCNSSAALVPNSE